MKTNKLMAAGIALFFTLLVNAQEMKSNEPNVPASSGINDLRSQLLIFFKNPNQPSQK